MTCFHHQFIKKRKYTVSQRWENSIWKLNFIQVVLLEEINCIVRALS
jgi:hypothetical protein